MEPLGVSTAPCGHRGIPIERADGQPLETRLASPDVAALAKQAVCAGPRPLDIYPTTATRHLHIPSSTIIRWWSRFYPAGAWRKRLAGKQIREDALVQIRQSRELKASCCQRHRYRTIPRSAQQRSGSPVCGPLSVALVKPAAFLAVGQLPRT